MIRTGVEDGSTRRSAYCFVRMDDGAIFKAASWSKPAKHPRGSIYATEITGVTPFGAAYLR